MGIVYPGGFDSFSEPSLPESTPLSEAGGGGNTRNHVQHHHDLGKAVEAVQENASFKDHDHSGDGSVEHGNKLAQANTHESADTDTATTALHHTIGLDANQAAAGNHKHDYRSDFITNKPYEICTSTTRPEPFPGKTIWETDTMRMRVWAQFKGEKTAIEGLYSTDQFNQREGRQYDLGEFWEQWYEFPYGVDRHDGYPDRGRMGTTGGSTAWFASTGWPNRCIARRIRPSDMHTLTDDQVIIMETNDVVQNYAEAAGTMPASNDVYFRMSDDGQTYVRVAMRWWKGSSGTIMLLHTTSGPTGEELLGYFSAQTNTPNKLWQYRLVGNRFECYMGVEYVGSIVDETNRVNTGHKGWGIGMQAGHPAVVWFGWPYYPWIQSIPNEIASVTISDAVRYSESPIWQLLPVGDVPRVGLGCGAPQEILQTGSMIEWGVVGEDNFGFFDPNNPTFVQVTEPGVYHVHASIAWSPHLYGDHAGTIIVVNDQPTVHSHWEFVRGAQYTAGFAQTVDVTCFLRLAAGDKIGVAAAHNGAGSQWTAYKKTAIAPDYVTQFSRFFMTFHSA